MSIPWIRSIRPVEVTIPAGSASASATIPAASPLAFILPQGQTVSADGNADASWARAELMNSTTITAFRHAANPSISVTVRCLLVDPSSALVDSVRHGVATIAGGTAQGTAAIAAVDPARSAVILLGFTSTYGAQTISGHSPRITLAADGSSVLAERTGGSSHITTVGFAVVQFAAGAIASRRQLAPAIAADVSPVTTLPLSPPVAPARSLVFPGGCAAASGQYHSASGTLELQADGASVVWTRQASNNSTRGIACTVIEFTPGVLSSVRRGVATLTAATQADAAIASVDPVRSTIHLTGFRANPAVDGQFGSVMPTAQLLDATTVRARRGVAGTLTTVASFEVAEFAGTAVPAPGVLAYLNRRRRGV